MANPIVTMLKAVAKHKMGIGELTGIERFMLSQIGLPDRVPTALGATNIEPFLIDPKYDWISLTQSPELNLELFDRICELTESADQRVLPVWMGLMFTGVVELGTEFKIEKHRVPYAVGFPINETVDIEKIKIPEKASGFFKMYMDINKEAQRRHPESMFTLIFDGPWDLAMLLRGENRLPLDMRLHKDYTETDDPVRKEKIKKRGDPFIYPAIMELTTQIAIRHIEIAKQYGSSLMGSLLVDQYAASPIMSRLDFVRYVMPYVERVWLAAKKKVGILYPCSSPMQIEDILENEPPGIAHQLFWSNYIFPTTPAGLTIPEYDEPAFKLAKKHKKSFQYMIHGKFLRDATREEIEKEMKRVLTLATKLRVSLSITIGAVTPGTDFDNVNFTLSMTKKYGRY